MFARSRAPGKQLERPFVERRGEASVGAAGKDTPVGAERVRTSGRAGNLRAALRRVKRNGGSPGIDGMTAEELPGVPAGAVARPRGAAGGDVRPQPVKRWRSEAWRGGAKTRDSNGARPVHPAGELQGLQPEWDKTVSDGSEGCRPGRSAHQARAQAQGTWGGLQRGGGPRPGEVLRPGQPRQAEESGEQRVAERRVGQRIDRYLKAGALTDEGLEATRQGTPQGGPLSPLRVNLLLDGLDKEWERRRHRFVRDADACNIDVKSARAGQRGWTRVTRFSARRLKLAVKRPRGRWTVRGGGRVWA